MNEIIFLLSIITFLALLFFIGYIYGKRKAKKIIKFSIFIPLIVALIFILFFILGHIYNWLTALIPSIKGLNILALLTIFAGAFVAHLENKKNK